MAAIIHDDDRAANDIIHKFCGKETVKFHPTQVMLLFPWNIEKNDDGYTVLQPVALPINHNHIDTHKGYDITNNMLKDVMNIKPDKIPTMSVDTMIYLVDYTEVSVSLDKELEFFSISEKNPSMRTCSPNLNLGYFF